MLQQQFLVSIPIQSYMSRMHARLARCRIKASCEYIFLASDVLNNPHLNQSVQPRLHLFIQRSLMIQCINRKEIFRR